MPILIKKDPDIIKSYFEDSSNLGGGYAEGVAFPVDIRALSAVISDADKKKIPLTISGGGTGTTGSRIPFGGMVVSLEKLNRIIDISKDKKCALAQAGVSVEDFKEDCRKKGLFYASHPTEKAAFLGGTIATNASGARSFRYGPTRKYVNRLKMVLANGEVLEMRRGEKTLTRGDSAIRLAGGELKIPLPAYRMPSVKNSAGYFAYDGMDAIDLFIGQEGTLSVIAEAELGLVGLPYKIFSAFVFFNDEHDAWAFAADARKSSALSIEYFDGNALKLLRGKSGSVPPLSAAAIFFEQEVKKDDEEKLMDQWLNRISGHNASFDDTWVAMTEDEQERFNEFRYAIPESINEMVKRNGFRKLSTDIAVPEDKFPEMMNFYVNTLRNSGIEHVIFGHIGECHLHVNLLPKKESELKRSEEICLAFAGKGVSLGGTVSAEHGIGKTRRKYLEIMYGREGLMEMARIKKALDPNCILGLDNIFPKELLALV